MKKLKLYEENSRKNIYDVLRIAFLYGDSDKLLLCNNLGQKWLEENELDKIAKANNQKPFNRYITPFGGFKLGGDDSGGKEGSILIKDDGHTIFWFNTTTMEYLWLHAAESISIDDHPEVVPKK